MANNQLDSRLPTREIDRILLKGYENTKQYLSNYENTSDNAFIEQPSTGVIIPKRVDKGVTYCAGIGISCNADMTQCGENTQYRSVLDIAGFRISPTQGYDAIGNKIIRAHDYDYGTQTAITWQGDDTQVLTGTEFTYEFTYAGYEVFRNIIFKTGAIGDGNIHVSVEAKVGGQWRETSNNIVVEFEPNLNPVNVAGLWFSCLEPTGAPLSIEKFRFRFKNVEGLSFQMLGNASGEPWVQTDSRIQTRYNLARRVEVEFPVEFGKSPLIPAGNFFDYANITMSAAKGYRDPYRDLVITSVTLDQTTSVTADVEILVDGVVEYTLGITGTQAQAQTSISVPKGDIVAVRSKTGSGVMQGPIVILTFRLEDAF